ncbi:hypothetical protein OMCYN_00145 [cyanobiont of Ornithocercus magnificus]|nr:hypothetical protein OMCYN_00145 [cyanobiont of Ornithocercus magnificus]
MLAVTLPAVTLAQSGLFDSIKQSPEEASRLCNYFSSLNQKSISAYSAQAINQIALARNISVTEAEVLVTYVVGLSCPGVR